MGSTKFRVVRNLECLSEYQISNALHGIGKCLAEEGEHGDKKLEPDVQQSDQSADVKALEGISMGVCLSLFHF